MVVVLLITSILPGRYLGWADWFSGQARVVMAPIIHPITLAINAIVPVESASGFGSVRERELLGEIDRLHVRLFQAEERSIELEALADQLARGAALQPDIPVTQLQRPRIGQSGEFLIIRPGSNEGIYPSVVVTARSVQIIGRVESVDARTSLVLPITSKNAQAIAGVVILDEFGGRRATCNLEPVGDGTLKGQVSPPIDGRADELQIGQTVRLLDESWPRHAQMLVIGEIERIEPSPTQPLRRLITVRPRLDLRRVSEVIVRLQASGSGG